MSKDTILILGGYGGAGRILAELLLRETDKDILIAGRNREKAEAFGTQLNSRHPGSRVSARVADAARPDTVEPLFREAGLAVISVPLGDLLVPLVKLALRTETDWIDLLFQPDTMDLLQPLSEEVVHLGRTVITQGGFHPGLPAALVREAATRFNTLESAVVGMAMNAHFPSTESTFELIDEFGETRMAVYRDGKWKAPRWGDTRTFRFDPPAGKQTCYPMAMAEMCILPQTLGLRETGVYVAGFNWFVDYLLLPPILLAQTLRKGLLRKTFGHLLCWGINTFSPAEDWVLMQLEAEGEIDKRTHCYRMTIFHEDPYYLTAAPVVCCLLQYFNEKLNPGLEMMAHAVEPKQLLADLEQLGIRIQRYTKPALTP